MVQSALVARVYRASPELAVDERLELDALLELVIQELYQMTILTATMVLTTLNIRESTWCGSPMQTWRSLLHNQVV